jgi:rhomboid protease GluP
LSHIVSPAIDSVSSRIPVRSKRQAMDWSLVLVSQGIESIIDHSPEDDWGLIVPVQEHQRALALILQYRAENRRWPWRWQVQQKVLFDWGSLGWVILICLLFWFDATRVDLKGPGITSASAVFHGQWWRLFTSIFLHADVGHLVANAVFGLVLLGLAMGRYGTGIALLTSCLAGAAGNLLACLVDPTHQSLGASGMVMGSLGLLATQPGWLVDVAGPRRKIWLGGAGAGLLLFLLLGSGSGTDLLAHLGGFTAGACLGLILGQFPKLFKSTTANILAGIFFCLLVLLTWRLALAVAGPALR